ncbi:hypothetical protein G9F72_021940 [Clostridium estertheticum]|uniref:hypothetical protein n=1 Tax=Clostridium estertheticum TaxID=238834 RepID=UPI0013E94EB9|nr:hypothetical protein [Clostridium estertheticum]MBZ9688984.1 hypothetical protein [Clostridium estertheticum]
MSKPSMFSKDYKKEIKKRKRKMALLIIVPIIGLIIFLITDFNALKNSGISMKNGINSTLLNKSKDKQSSTVQVEKTPQVVKPQSDAEKTKVKKAEEALKAEAALKNEIFVASLSDGQKISIEFNVVAAEKTIKGVTDAKNISYDISPSKKSIVIQSKSNQDLLYVDVNKVSKDITKKTYESSKGEMFSKEGILKSHITYLWSITPKFIDEDNIAYVSELPWINDKGVKYIWKVNLKSNVHMQVKPASGMNITFGNITSKGLATFIDGKAVYVTSNGEVIE